MWGEFGGLSQHIGTTVTETLSGPSSGTGDVALQSRKFDGGRLSMEKDCRVVGAAGGPWHMITICDGEGRSSSNDSGDLLLSTDGNTRVEAVAQEERQEGSR